MSRFLPSGGGGLTLARRPLILAGRISLISVPRFPQSSQIRHKASWPEWIGLHPTTLEELTTVYKVCKESRVLGPTVERPITPQGPSKRTKPNVRNVYNTFLETPGLQSADWRAHRIAFHSAVEIALRLHQEHLFSGQTPYIKRKLTPILAQWPKLWDQARNTVGPELFDQARARVLIGDTSTIVASRTAKVTASFLARQPGPAQEQRRSERRRERAERDADVVDGVRSVSRGLGGAAREKAKTTRVQGDDDASSNQAANQSGLSKKGAKTTAQKIVEAKARRLAIRNEKAHIKLLKGRERRMSEQGR